jgi:hypothetical protein
VGPEDLADLLQQLRIADDGVDNWRAHGRSNTSQPRCRFWLDDAIQNEAIRSLGDLDLLRQPFVLEERSHCIRVGFVRTDNARSVELLCCQACDDDCRATDDQCRKQTSATRTGRDRSTSGGVRDRHSRCRAPQLHAADDDCRAGPERRTRVRIEQHAIDFDLTVEPTNRHGCSL